MEYTLTMTFIAESGEKSNVSISDVKSGITSDEALEIMDSIIENNVFQNKNGAYITKESAQVVVRQVTKFTV